MNNPYYNSTLKIGFGYLFEPNFSLNSDIDISLSEGMKLFLSIVSFAYFIKNLVYFFYNISSHSIQKKCLGDKYSYFFKFT